MDLIMQEVKEKRVELILRQLEQLPTLPAVAVKVLEATGRKDSSSAQIADLIKLDPALTVKVLKLVRRADMGVRGEVSTVDKAVSLLGFDCIRSAVLAISAMGVFPVQSQDGSKRFDRLEFWKHSLAVGCAAELIAERNKDIDASEAFVCGLLHDIGKIALDSILPKSYERVLEASELLRGNIADVERTAIGIDHMVAGKRLSEQWQLPAVIRDCIWLHDHNPETLPESLDNAKMVNLVTLADILVRQQHIGHSGNYSTHVSETAIRSILNLEDGPYEEIKKKVIQRIERRAADLGLGDSSSGDLYISALARANQELGRVGEQLAAKNRRLTLRSKYFEALSRFQSELRPDAPSSMVLSAIAQTAESILSQTKIVVFATQPRQAFAEVIICGDGGEITDSSVVACPSKLYRTLDGNGPVLPAKGSLEWLLARVSPALAGSQRFWIPLEIEGICIGGVVWGAEAGESQRLSPQAQELTALAAGWSLALRTCQFRDDARTLAEQLADANRRLSSAQENLVRAQSMASVGEMAAGAAHEMNNPLAVISGRAQLLASSLEEPKFKQAAQLICDQAGRLSQMITDLMDFAKPAAPHPAPQEVSELIDRAIHEVKMRENQDRKVEITLPEIPRVNVDKDQIKSAIVEILHNAWLATDQVNGKIMIHAAYDVFSSRVALTIADNGPGMDSETLKKAFDPFFCGQSAGRRRGMGLSKALRWIECCGGTIRLESRPNEGARAMVLLPAAPRTQSLDAATESKTARG